MSDDLVVLAALLDGTEWMFAESIASVVRRLGVGVSPQKMAATLRRLSLEECPMIEARDAKWAPLKEYRVTGFGRTQLSNRFKVPREWAFERR